MLIKCGLRCTHDHKLFHKHITLVTVCLTNTNLLCCLFRPSWNYERACLTRNQLKLLRKCYFIPLADWTHHKFIRFQTFNSCTQGGFLKHHIFIVSVKNFSLWWQKKITSLQSGYNKHVSTQSSVQIYYPSKLSSIKSSTGSHSQDMHLHKIVHWGKTNQPIIEKLRMIWIDWRKVRGVLYHLPKTSLYLYANYVKINSVKMNK